MRCQALPLPVLFLLLLSGRALFAQPKPVSLSLFSAGFKLGAPVKDPPGRSSLFSRYQQGRWTGGPSVELRLARGFAIEFDALYRTEQTSVFYPLRFGQDANPYLTAGSSRTNSWDFPLLLKYRFQVGTLRPFVSAGYQWSRQSVFSQSVSQCSGPRGSCLPAGYAGIEPPGGGSFRYVTTRSGPAAGAGIEFKTRYVTISPEVRYSASGDRITALVGFTFGGKR